ncbi:ATP-binding protein [Streptomyces sp. NPDC056161]|uniref:ATP-binding protein n=1 Tax=Streptomyces sp. NPDC056161 TaxID=3345732 RepID=UPI0035E180BB
MATEPTSSTIRQAPGSGTTLCGTTDLPVSPTEPPATQLFVGGTSAVPRARTFVSQTLRGWGITERTDDVLLCTTELAANACLHTEPNTGEFLVRVVLHHSTLRVEVHDRDPHRPHVTPKGGEGVTGRGLLLVQRIADRCGTDPKPFNGKAVWADFAV